MTERDSERPRDGELDRADLDAWLVPDPPVDLADRVLAARQRELDTDSAQKPPRRRAWIPIGVVAAAAMTALIVRAVGSSPDAVTGALAAEQRQSVRLGHRGVAVAEVGADIAWKVDSSGAARIEQRAGNVFYRVDRGGSFQVQTPAGVVTVRGTCFRIDIDGKSSEQESEQMKPSKYLALGAAAGALVVVTVYEGRVLFADRKGRQSEVAAGDVVRADEQGTLTAGAAGAHGQSPAQDLPAPPRSDAPRDELLARDEVQRTEIAQLRKKLRDMEATAGAGGGRRGLLDEERWSNPTKEDLLEWAKECRVNYDLPPVLDVEPPTIDSKRAAKLGLNGDEAAVLNDVLHKLWESHTSAVRKLYIEATGDTAGAETLSPEAMAREIQDKAPRGEGERIVQAIARERAGLQAPPTDLTGTSALERYQRLLASMGGETEAMIAAKLGAERAKELRSKEGGWGHRMSIRGCPEDSEEEEKRR